MTKKTETAKLTTTERVAIRLAQKEGAVRPCVLARTLNKKGEMKATTVGWIAYNAIMALVDKGMVKQAGRGQYVLTKKAAVA